MYYIYWCSFGPHRALLCMNYYILMMGWTEKQCVVTSTHINPSLPQLTGNETFSQAAGNELRSFSCWVTHIVTGAVQLKSTASSHTDIRFFYYNKK